MSLKIDVDYDTLEKWLESRGWVHCKCQPPNNWNHDSSDALLCWKPEWALDWELRKDLNNNTLTSCN